MTATTRQAIDYESMTDTELVGELQRGQRAAFGVVIQHHNQRLYRVARSVLCDDIEAEDVVQEAYVKAFSNFGGFRGQASLATWLTRIVLNEALDRRRRRRTTAPLDEVDNPQTRSGTSVVLLHPSYSASDPEKDSARAEIRRLVEGAVDRLPEAFRMVFVMRDIEEMSVEETAEHLGIPQATVKTRLHRARKLVRAELEDSLASALAGSFPFAGSRCAQMTDVVLSRLGYPPASTR